MVTPVAQQNKLSKMLVTSLVQNNTIYASILIYNVVNYKMYYHKLIKSKQGV